ncbi:MAG: hypothetical protein LRY27_04710 [Chitinophagales bacterium]|nr:hypothetical protein [Chitinophagales bacterium]
MQWKYAKTSMDTTDKAAQEKLQTFYVEIQPQMTPWENKLQQKFNNSPFKENLPSSFNNIKKGIATDLKLFKQENIELIKEASLLENEYDQITGIQQINYKGQDLTMPQAHKLLKNPNRENTSRSFLL